MTSAELLRMVVEQDPPRGEYRRVVKVNVSSDVFDKLHREVPPAEVNPLGLVQPALRWLLFVDKKLPKDSVVLLDKDGKEVTPKESEDR